MAFACLIRSSCACARVGARLAPTPASPANAVPVKAPPDAVRKSRRDRSMAIPYANGQSLKVVLSDGLSEPPVTTATASRKNAQVNLHSIRGAHTPVWMVGDDEALRGVRKRLPASLKGSIASQAGEANEDHGRHTSTEDIP